MRSASGWRSSPARRCSWATTCRPLSTANSAWALRALAGTDVSDIRSGDLAEAIRKGDKAIEKLVRARAGVIGAALSNLVDFVNPDTIVLGGGLVEALPRLMKREIRRTIDAQASPRGAKAVDVVVAKLGGHAGTAGAAKLALDMFSGDPPIASTDI